jgi:hypothetical protein
LKDSKNFLVLHFKLTPFCGFSIRFFLSLDQCQLPATEVTGMDNL